MEQKRLYIKNSFKLPDFLFDAQTGELRIYKRSLPEDAYNTFGPALEWIEEYLKNPKKETKLIIDLDYMNSSTIKVLTYLINRMKNATNTKLTVYWYYSDEDTQEICNDVKSITEADIKIIPKIKD